MKLNSHNSKVYIGKLSLSSPSAVYRSNKTMNDDTVYIA